MTKSALQGECPGCADWRRQNEILEAKVVTLEAELAAARKNSGNSSKPPSSDIVKARPKANKRGRPKKRKIGGQPGHARHQRGNGDTAYCRGNRPWAPESGAGWGRRIHLHCHPLAQPHTVATAAERVPPGGFPFCGGRGEVAPTPAQRCSTGINRRRCGVRHRLAPRPG